MILQILSILRIDTLRSRMVQQCNLFKAYEYTSKENSFCDFSTCFPRPKNKSKMVSTLKGKTLHLQEQILTFKS